MKVLLHIGQSKTGTSAIQAFLTLNREKLAEQGILYPGVRIGGLPLDIGSHNALADALMGLSRFPFFSPDRYFDEFFSQAERINAHLLILSAEHFFGGEPRVWDVSSEDEYFSLYRKKIEYLSKYLSTFETSVLVYLRPQIDWLESAISQTIRISGLISQKDLYQSDAQFYQMMKPVLKYNSLLSAWTEVLNPQRIIAIPYQRETLRNNSTIDDFLTRAGLEDIDFPFATSSIEVNSSMTREYVEVKKILNQTERSKTRERVIIECLQRLSMTGRYSRTYRITSELAREIAFFAQDENAEVNRKFIAPDTRLAVSTGGRKEMALPSQQDIREAMLAFENEYNSVRGQMLLVDYALRAFLRKYARPIHSALHQLRRSQRKFAYRK